MIVIGVDVHKQSVTAVAVDEAGRMLDEKTAAVGSDELIGWAFALGAERLWALEDCRGLTRWLERQLVAVGEQQVRVPPKLTVPERRAGRERGKSDPIDALAIARAALREPDLSRPRPGEQVFRDLKLLVDHRDDLVDERRRAQQRLRWHLHQLDPTYVVPAKALDRPVRLERVGRWLSRQTQELQVRLARELRARCRSLNRIIVELDRELEQRTAELGRPYSSCRVVARSRRRSCWPRSARSTASRATRNSHATVRWRDVALADPAGATLRVRETWVRGATDTPKSEKSERTIAIGQLAGELFDHRARTAYAGDDERVFCNPRSGGVLDERRYAATLRLALKRAGITDYVRPFHDFRHTSITNAAQAGMSQAALMARAGHSDFKTTQGYIDLAGETFREEAELLDARVFGQKLGQK
jgi:transposase